MYEYAQRLRRDFLTSERDTVCSLLRLTDITVSGFEHLESLKGLSAILGVFPHTGHSDSVAVRFALPDKKRLVFLAKASYWGGARRVLGELTNPLILLPTDGNGSPLEAMKQARDLLKSGYYIGIAPEGTRTNKPVDQRPFFGGIRTLLAITDYQYPLVPIILKGFQEVWPKGQKLPHPFTVSGINIRRKKTRVHIGVPVFYNRTDKLTLVEDFRQRCIAEYEDLKI